MFGIGKKKKSKVEEDLEEIEKKSKKKKKEKDQGPAWMSVVILILSVLAGVFFWVYGQLSSNGFVGVSFMDNLPGKKLEGVDVLQNDGVIIFEKQE